MAGSRGEGSPGLGARLVERGGCAARSNFYMRWTLRQGEEVKTPHQTFFPAISIPYQKTKKIFLVRSSPPSPPVRESLPFRIGYNAWRCVEAGPVPGRGRRRKASCQASAKRHPLRGRQLKSCRHGSCVSAHAGRQSPELTRPGTRHGDGGVADVDGHRTGRGNVSYRLPRGSHT